MAQSHVEDTTEELAQASVTLWFCVLWKESGQGSREVSRCEVVEDSKDELD